ncbi:MAG: hypothetical protein WA966_14795 [Ornithinimicrobium sp.]
MAGPSGSRSALVLIQLGSAGAALIAWLALSVLVPAEPQQEAVAALSIGTVVGLVLSLGVPVILPNLLRGVDLSLGIRGTAGAVPLIIVGLLSAVACVLGSAAFIAGLGGPAPLAAGYGGALASGQAAAQLARVRYDLLTMAVSVLPVVMFPVSWLAVLSADLAPLSSRVVVGVCLVACLASSQWRVLRSRGTAGARVGRSQWAWLGQAIPLVPHMIFFSALLQGPRLVASFSADAELLIAVHIPMLVLNGCFTALAAFNAVWTVTVQMSDDADLHHRWTSLCTQMLVAGAGLAVLAGVTIVVLLKLEFVEPVGSGMIVLAALAPFVLSLYYAGAAVVVRDGQRSVTFPAASGLGLGTMVVISLMAPAQPWLQLGVALSVTMAVMLGSVRGTRAVPVLPLTALAIGAVFITAATGALALVSR